MASTGQGGTIAIATETTFGVRPASPAWEFFPWMSESLTFDKERMENTAILPDQQSLHADQRNGGPVSAGGDLQLNLQQAGQEILLEHMFGDVDVTGSGPYVRTYVPADLKGKSFTTQIVRPDVGGTSRPFDYLGCKVASWSLAFAVGEWVTLAVTLVARNEVTNQTAATPVFIADAKKAYKFVYATVTTLAGQTIKIKSGTLTGDNKLATDRRFMEAGGLIAEPLTTDLKEFAGDVTTEFVSLAQYNQYLADTVAELVLTFASGDNEFEITAQVQFGGTTPNMGGRGIIDQALPFKCLETDAAPPIKVVMTNSTED